MFSTPIESNRFLIVPVDSSAARIHFPGATSSRAVVRIASLMVMSLLPERSGITSVGVIGPGIG